MPVPRRKVAHTAEIFIRLNLGSRSDLGPYHCLERSHLAHLARKLEYVYENVQICLFLEVARVDGGNLFRIRRGDMLSRPFVTRATMLRCASHSQQYPETRGAGLTA